MIRTIDFNNLATGENVTNQYEDIGVRVSATATPPGSDKAMIFDSNAPTGGDTDLATDNLDNVLIISEDGNAAAPNDNETGGAFTFKFDDPVSIKSLTFLDIEGGARLLFFGADGGLLSEQWVAPTGDNGQSVVQLFVPGTVRFEVEMEGTGAIDNLVFDDQNAVNPVDPVDPVPPVDPTGDGIVSGDETDNTIDLAYTGDPEGDRVDAGDALLEGEAPDDDIIDANCGDDTISAGAGDDDIYAGGGDDVVSGGAGNDLIYGDSTLASAARESFNWSDAGFGPDETITDFTQNTGTVKVTYSNVKPSPKFVTSFSDDEQNTSNVDGGTETVSSTSSLSSVGFVSEQETRYALGFNTPVSNVEFNINDIDGDSVVRVQAFNAAGAPVGVMLVGGDGLTLLDTDGVPGADTADSNGGYADAPNPAYSMTVSIAGPVSRVEITHEQDGPDNTSVNITDVFFTPGEAGAVCEDGNDSLSGDEGDDTIFGEGGNDTIIGGVGADSLSGGDDADLFVGGNAGDVVDGGTDGDDRDTLDLSDSGPLRVVDQTLDADGDSTSGTIEFLNEDGTVSGSMTFTEIETLILPDDPVDPENFAPVATDDTAVTDEETLVNIAVLANDTDPEGDALTITEATSEHGTVAIRPNGTLDFTPNPDFFGEAVIDYTITDGNGGFDDSRVFVTVNNVNDAPVANDDTAITGVGESVTIPVLVNDTDADNDPLTVTAATSPNGDVVINSDGTITFTPTPGFTGDASIDYTVDDGNGGTDTAQVSVSVGETSGPPVAVDDTAVTNEDTEVTIPVLANDTDPEDDTLTVTAATSPNGDVVINDNGTITFTPAPDFNGEAVITYDITDGNGGVDTAEVVVTVNPVNDGPLAEDDTAIVNAGGTVVVPVLLNDSDIENDPLTVISASSPNGTVEINPDNTLSFTPADGFTGDAVVNYTISDGELTDPAVVFVNVRDGIVTGTDDGDLIDEDYTGDPEGDLVDNLDEFLPGEGPNDDIIVAGGGDDTVLAGLGDDDVSGGDGDDSIDGGVGDDELDGDAGNDTLTGGDGSDTVTGGVGDDVIDTSGSDPRPDIGYPGVFSPDADPENDRDSVDGGDGNDTIRTGDDRDTINGGAGDDVINSGIDDDIVDGGDGNDRIVGAEGNDSILGGAGNDTIYANNDPELGLDAFEIEDDGSNPLGPDLRPGNGRDTVDGGAGDDLIFGGDDDDLLMGGSGDDTLDGGIDDDVLLGGTGNDLLIGGQGNDTMTGGDDRDTFVDVNAGDVVDGSEGGDDFDVLDLSGSAPDGGSLRVTLSPENVENGVVNYFNADGTDAGQLVFTNIERVVPCFTPGTLIATPKGERKVEELEVGDRIITRDNGMQVIRWIGKRDMSGEELAAKEHLRPVLIRQGALGNDLPERDMMVSPQHRVLIANDKTALYFEEREVLVAAKHLTDMEGIDVVDVSHTTYIHIMFDQHEVILSDGTWTESFQPGDMSLAGVGDASREEILELFPELATREGIEAYAAARKSLKKHEAKLITKNS